MAPKSELSPAPADFCCGWVESPIYSIVYSVYWDVDSHFLDHSYLIACGKYQNSEAQSYSGTLDIIVNLCNLTVCEDKIL